MRLTCALILSLAACGGGGSKKGQTTPTGGKPPGKGDNVGVAYQDMPGGFQSAPGGNAEDMPAAPPIEPTPAPAPTAANPVLRPPTHDLPPERARAVVDDNLRRGAQAVRTGDADGAIRHARAALEVEESNAEAMIVLGHGYYLKEYDDMVESVLTIAQKQPAGQNHPVLWMLLGLVYDRTKREDKALAAYERATQLKPDYLAALTNRGAIYLKRKRYADAVQVFETVVQISPNSPSAHVNLGSAYRGRSADMNENKPARDDLLRRAEGEYRAALARDVNHAPAYFNLGILYLDADPFPGVDTLPRLQAASKFFTEYKSRAGARTVAVVDEYISASQKAYEREEKLLKRKQKKDAEKAAPQ